jgi:hypothetical protein
MHKKVGQISDGQYYIYCGFRRARLAAVNLVSLINLDNHIFKY